MSSGASAGGKPLPASGGKHDRPDADPALLAFSQAALAVTRNLSLDSVLQQICDSARELGAARYSALGVFDSGGNLASFSFSGMSAEESFRVGRCPEGLGLLGAIAREGHTLLVADIAADPRAVGFPPGHPPMTTFLGVPIRHGEETLGNLYLTDKIDAAGFTQQDAQRIEILAAHAAIAISNARLYQASLEREKELATRNRELASLNLVARSASTYLKLEELLRAVVEEVLSVTRSDAGEMFLRDEASGDMVRQLHLGEAPEAFQMHTRFALGQGYVGRAAEQGKTLAARDLAADPGLLSPEIVEAGFRSYVCIPLRARDSVNGVLALASREAGRLDERELTLLEAIGHQIGVAVENARLYQQVGLLAVSEERSRIGMDLHDGVIQSIYAVGLSLEAVRHIMHKDPDKAAAMLDQGVSGLNDAIRDIRNFILDLRPRNFEGDLRKGLARLIREFQANTMVEVTLHAQEELLRALPASVARTLFLTTQEALANIARHARASNVIIRLNRQERFVVLSIEDDGVGFDISQQASALGHGLANMRSRSEELSGQFHIQSSPGQGTVISLALPLATS
jgi:signal transduction histidine kinase